MTPNLFLTFNLFMSRMAGWKGIYILLLGEEEGCIKKYFEGTSKKKKNAMLVTKRCHQTKSQ